MEGAPEPHLIVDFDKPGSPLGPDQTRCDFLFIAEGAEGRSWVVPLELKRGRLHADEVVRQLQEGARFAERLVPSNEPIRFRPVAASSSRPKAERDRLKRRSSRVRFHGHFEAIRLMSCSAPLTEALGA